MPEQQPQQSSSKEGSSSAGNKRLTRYRVVKDGWGSRPIFQSSYGLGMDPDSIEEGNAILDAFIDYEMENNSAEKK
ncbi:hypothetical protein FAVG1_09346 [Fusarium avenaceum]|nr:hypothetical protein FAVG1_09346 [Fusarium avenaceum]